ncbi:MAG: nitrogen fixation negative regulator NifL [Rhodocyclaceae bacterium]|nr:nitrogen fixation negative regulator NifL [Rhodocyclaceae bacterium]
MSALSRGRHPAQESTPDLPTEAYRQAVDQADIAISITDPHANILFANEAFSRVTGYAPTELIGQNESVLSNHTTPPALYKEMWSRLSEQRAWTGRLLNRRKDGALYLADVSISPVVDAGGRTSHFLGIHRDVTELHRLERVVRNQKLLIETAVDAAPMALALLDQQGRVILDNQEYKKLVSDLQVPEPAHCILDALEPAWRSIFTNDPARCAAFSGEACIDRLGGRTRWLSATVSPVDLQSDCADSYFCTTGQPGLLLVISDVTSLRESRERDRAAALRLALTEEERTAAVREGLSAALFRLDGPMNMMASAISVLRRRDPVVAQVLEDALAESRTHMEELRNVIPPMPREIRLGINLNEILRDVLEISTARMLAAGITVDWRPTGTLPAVQGCPLQLRMLFKALVDNAIEAMNVKGWNRRELTVTSAVRDDRIAVTIADSGPGIPAELRHKAFEPFFSNKGSGRAHLGTGLSRAQQVVSDHGGIIDLVQGPGGGCTALVEFRVDGDPI